MYPRMIDFTGFYMLWAFNVCMQPLVMHCSEMVPDTARHYIRVVMSFGWTGLNDVQRENRNRLVRASTKCSGPDLALTCWSTPAPDILTIH